MRIRVAGWGDVTIEQLEAMFLAYINAGAPKPLLEGTPEEQRAVLALVRERGDFQMKSVMDLYLEGEKR